MTAIAVLDYGIGNLRSAQKALERVGADATLTADPEVIAAARGIVLPGVGNLVVRAVLRRDYPVIQGTLLVIAAIYVFINLAIDFIYTLVDPRIRLESK